MAESELEVKYEKKLAFLQAQINALQAGLQRVLRATTHPSAMAVIKSQLGDLLGTTNQVNVVNGKDCVNKKDDVTLSLPQNIHTGATPTFAGLGLGAAPTAGVIHETLTASDLKGIYIDGNVDYTGTGVPCTIDVIRDYNVGTGDVNNCCGISNYMYPKHTGAKLVSTKYAYGAINRLISAAAIANATAVLKYLYQFGEYAWVDDRNAYDTSAAGQLMITNTAVKAICDCSAIFTDSGGTGPNTSIKLVGVDIDITGSPTLSSGVLYPIYMGTSISVTGTGTGSSVAYGIYIETVTGADANFSIYDGSGNPWRIASGAASSVALVDGIELWVQDVNGAAGYAGLHKMTETTAQVEVVPGVIIKADTGSPASPYEGLMEINTFDNRVRMYADAGWRELGAW